MRFGPRILASVAALAITCVAAAAYYYKSREVEVNEVMVFCKLQYNVFNSFDKLMSFVESAKERIDVCMPGLHSPAIYGRLVNAVLKKKLKLRFIIDRSGYRESTDFFLTELINAENNLDFECLGMDDGELKELIPDLRDRIKYKNGYKKYKEEINTIESNTDSMDTSSLDSLLFDSDDASYKEKITKEEVASNKVNLLEILADNIHGRQAIQAVKAKKLDDQARNNLVKGIIEYYLKKNARLSKAEFHSIAKEIVKLCPKECEETYYVPCRSLGDKKCIPAKGKLVDRYYNQSRMLKANGVIPKKRKLDPEVIEIKIGAEIKCRVNNNNQHHKFCIIDGKMILTGTLNWGDDRSSDDWNYVYVTNRSELVAPVVKEFDQMWNAQNLSPKDALDRSFLLDKSDDIATRDVDHSDVESDETNESADIVDIAHESQLCANTNETE